MLRQSRVVFPILLHIFVTVGSIERSADHGSKLSLQEEQHHSVRSAIEIADSGLVHEVNPSPRKAGSRTMRREVIHDEQLVLDPNKNDDSHVHATIERNNISLVEQDQYAESEEGEYSEAGKQDCKWSSWSGWSRCTKTCGVGTQRRTRQLLKAPRGRGRKCDDPGLTTLERACNTPPCSIDCKWKTWDPWTPCTTTCGGGSKKRVRDKAHTKEHKGKDCAGPASEAGKCGTDPCPIDCQVKEWSEWGNCTEDCGSGQRMREKVILIPDQHGGAPCPATKENGTCNEDACPIKAHSRMSTQVSSIVALCAWSAAMFASEMRISR